MQDQVSSEQVESHVALSIVLAVSLSSSESSEFWRLEDQSAIFLSGAESEAEGRVVVDDYALSQEESRTSKTDESIGRHQLVLHDLQQIYDHFSPE